MSQPRAAKRLTESLQLGPPLAQKQGRQQRIPLDLLVVRQVGEVGEQPSTGSAPQRVPPSQQGAENACWSGRRHPDEIAPRHEQRSRPPLRSGVPLIVELAGIQGGRKRVEQAHRLHLIAGPERGHRLPDPNQQLTPARRGLAGA